MPSSVAANYSEAKGRVMRANRTLFVKDRGHLCDVSSLSQARGSPNWLEGLSGGPDSSHYSPLHQITKANMGSLHQTSKIVR